MLKVRNIKVFLDENLEEKLIKKLRINKSDILKYEILKKSIDARNKNDIHFVYTIALSIKNENKVKFTKDIEKYVIKEYKFNPSGKKNMKYRPIVVGSGPAGLFCAYMLAFYGYKPIILERGEDVDSRSTTVNNFWNKGILNENSNVQFGEGGAGTFSDGKLNTLVKDKNNIMKKVFEIFVDNGAPEEIKYVNNPHIGTDILKEVVKNIRNKIISMGGEYRFNTCLTDLIIENNKIVKIELNKKELIDCDNLILAIGHSSRDTFLMLHKNKIEMSSKPFAIGLRIEHSQKFINKSQYGKYYELLEPASYKLTYKAKNNKGVYSFCMCPGGYVVNASSEKGLLAINGMSNYKRNSSNANSALVVTVSNEDYGNDLFSGMNFQRDLEKKAYEVGNGKIPIQLIEDFYNNKVSNEFKTIKPEIKGNYSFTNINDILPKNISDTLKEAIEFFNTKIKNYKKDAILSAIESRTSSPIRIIRDDNYMSNIYGIYPIGEGAGYAGGITTSAMDGIRAFEKIANVYNNQIGQKH